MGVHVFYNDVTNSNELPEYIPSGSNGSCPNLQADVSLFQNDAISEDIHNTNLERVLNVLDISDACKQTMRDIYTRVKNEFALQYSSHPGGGCYFFACGSGFQNGTSFLNMIDSLDSQISSEFGCSNIFQRVSEIFRSSTLIQCHISGSTNSSTNSSLQAQSNISLNSNANISLIMSNNQDQYISTVLEVVGNTHSTNSDLIEQALINGLSDTYLTNLRELIDLRNQNVNIALNRLEDKRMSISGSSLSATANIRLRKVNVVSTNQFGGTISQNFQNIVQNMVEIRLLDTFDVSDLSPDLKASILQLASQNFNDTEITNIVNNNYIQVHSSTNIVVHAYGNITLTNSQLRADSEIDLVLCSILGEASNKAFEIYNDIMQSALRNRSLNICTGLYAELQCRTLNPPSIHSSTNHASDSAIIIISISAVIIVFVVVVVTLLIIRKL